MIFFYITLAADFLKMRFYDLQFEKEFHSTTLLQNLA
jgi:hypothetical protein